MKSLKDLIHYIGSILLLVWDAILWFPKKPIKWRRIASQMFQLGARSLWIVSLVALFTGIILALQTAYQLRKLSSEIYIADLVSLSLVRELGPVLTSLIVAGRAGAAITAQIGTMNVTEQIDALKTMATEPVKYIVVPRFIGLVITLPCLVIYADIVGIIGGYIVGVYWLHLPGALFWRMSFKALLFKDLFTGLFKTVIFAILIVFICCYEGLRTEGGAEGVGKSTTNAVVRSFIAIIAFDCIFTAIFYFIL